MPIEDKDELETGAESATDHGDSVSNRSESELEGKPSAQADDLDDEDSRDAGDQSGDPQRQVEGLKKRIAKLTAQRNKSRESETRLAAAEARLADYAQRERDREERRRQREAATPEAHKEAERRAAVRATIDDAYGAGTSELLERQREEADLARESYALNGVSYLKSELEDHGLPITDDVLVRYERAVGSELQEDAKLLAAYRRPATQQRAIQVAFERVREGLLNPVLKQRGAKEVERITRTREAVLGGGRNTGAVAQAEEPTFDLKPPKGITGRALEDWWVDAREKYREQLDRAS